MISQNLAQIPALSKPVFCDTHKHQSAKSICYDCKTFSCMAENCGQPHIYHAIENLEYLANSQLKPMLSTLTEVNLNFSGTKKNYLNSLHTFKNKFKNFSLEKKRGIEEEYRKVVGSLNELYNMYMDEINNFTDNLNDKFDSLIQRVDNLDSHKDLTEINSYVAKVAAQEGQNSAAFFQKMGPRAKQLNQKVKGINNNLNKFNFDKEIEDLKKFASKEYSSLEKNNYFEEIHAAVVKNISNLSKEKKAKMDENSLGKMKKVIKMHKTVLRKDAPRSKEVDLDLFVRYLAEELNKIRADPKLVVPLIQEHVDFLSLSFKADDPSAFADPDKTVDLNETIANRLSSDKQVNSERYDKLNELCQYIKYLDKKKTSLPPLEWDNDLSNSAEDYLKTTNGKVDKHTTQLEANMRNIVDHNYYSSYPEIKTISYIGSQELNRIIINILLNGDNYGHNDHLIFENFFNVVGISAVENFNKISLLMNLSKINKWH